MVYGIVCFATLFSFVGTILGGIWADQSWGRFWGWDKKENGALLIVLIRQSIRTLHFDQNYEWIVIGCAIILAVVVDQSSTRLTAKRLAGRAAITGESP